MIFTNRSGCCVFYKGVRTRKCVGFWGRVQEALFGDWLISASLAAPYQPPGSWGQEESYGGIGEVAPVGRGFLRRIRINDSLVCNLLRKKTAAVQFDEAESDLAMGSHARERRRNVRRNVRLRVTLVRLRRGRRLLFAGYLFDVCVGGMRVMVNTASGLDIGERFLVYALQEGAGQSALPARILAKLVWKDELSGALGMKVISG